MQRSPLQQSPLELNLEYATLQVEDFMKLVRNTQYEEIEGARGRVRPEHLDELIQAYWTLETWLQKASFIDLVQDQMDPRLRPVFLDILKAPDPGHDDSISIPKATALCHLNNDFDLFNQYYKDRNRVEREAQEWVRGEQS